MVLAWDDPAAIAGLRRALDNAGYSVLGIRRALGTGEELSSQPADVAVHLRRLPPANPLSTLIKLFLLGVTVEADESRLALAGVSLDRLERLGLIEAAGTMARAPVRLLPHEKLLIACDRKPDPDSGTVPADWVTGLDPPAMLLANLTVRRPVGAALDMGTGCGIQALLAAPHCESVVATDLNPRALAFVEFNKRLNGIDNIECRQGDLFAPVQGQSFDLIVCNPPYVISPDHDYIYRDSGLPQDTLCRRVVEQAPGHLNENGFSQALVSWVVDPRGDWSAPLRDWTQASDCDAWLLHARTEDPLTHAAKWNRPTTTSDLAVFPQTLDRWLEYDRRSGIEAIAFGAVIQRRRSDRPNWIRTDELPPGSIRSAGDHVERVFANQDYLQERPADSALLDGVVRAAEGIRLEEAFDYRNGSWNLDRVALRLESGIPFIGGADPPIAGLLARLDGRRSVRQALQEMAADIDIGVDQGEGFIGTAVPVVRRLLELGFLTLAGAPLAAGSKPVSASAHV